MKKWNRSLKTSKREKITPKTKEEWIAKHQMMIDDIIEDMESYIETESNMSYADELFNRICLAEDSFLSQLYDSAVQEEQRKSIESDERLKGIIQSMKREIEYLRSSQPSRGKPIIRIKQGDNWYIPKITKAIDDPEGLYIEAEL